MPCFETVGPWSYGLNGETTSLTLGGKACLAAHQTTGNKPLLLKRIGAWVNLSVVFR